MTRVTLAALLTVYIYWMRQPDMSTCDGNYAWKKVCVETLFGGEWNCKVCPP